MDCRIKSGNDGKNPHRPSHDDERERSALLQLHGICDIWQRARRLAAPVNFSISGRISS